MCLIPSSVSLNLRQSSLSMKPFYRSISNTSEEYSPSDSGISAGSSSDCEEFRDSTMDPGYALRSTLKTALSQGRLTCGIYEAAQLLEMAPGGVMLCIVPEDASTDVTLHIHLTLIEAFCWENDIRLLKVDSSEKLQEIVTSSSATDGEIKRMLCNADDFNCILVEYPQNTQDMTEEEEEIILYHKETCDAVPSPVIPLADTP